LGSAIRATSSTSRCFQKDRQPNGRATRPSG
jgi:hypothetical protein